MATEYVDNEVKVVVTADTEPLKKKLADAKNSIKGFGSSAQDVKINAKVSGLSGSIGNIKSDISKSVTKGIQEGVYKGAANIKSDGVLGTAVKASFSGILQGALSGKSVRKELAQLDLGGVSNNLKSVSKDLKSTSQETISAADKTAAALKTISDELAVTGKQQLEATIEAISQQIKASEEKIKLLNIRISKIQYKKELGNQDYTDTLNEREYVDALARETEYLNQQKQNLEDIKVLKKQINGSPLVTEQEKNIAKEIEETFGGEMVVDMLKPTTMREKIGIFFGDILDKADELKYKLGEKISGAFGKGKAKISELSHTMQQTTKDATKAAAGASEKVAGVFSKEDLSAISAVYSEVTDILIVVKIIVTVIKAWLKTAKQVLGIFKKITGAISKTVAGILSITGKAAVSAVKGYLKAIQGIGTVAKSLVSVSASALKNFTKIFSMFSYSYKEGITRLYEWSSLNNGTFAQSLDKITGALKTIENSVAVIVAPIINKLAPIIDSLTDKVLTLANALAKVFAMLTGAKSYTKATKAIGKFKEEAEGAAAAVKRILINIDELNRLDDNSGGGGAGGIADQFEEVSTSLEDLEDPFKMGVNFGNKILELLNGIDWETIKQKAKEIGEKLAQLINGIFSVDGLGDRVGNALAEAVNTAFRFLEGFVYSIDVTSIAHQIGELVNGFFRDLEGEQHGKTLGKIVQNAFDWLREFLATLNTRDIGASIARTVNGFFSEIDGEKIGLTLSTAVNKAFSLLRGYIETYDPTAVAKDVSNLISSFFGNIDFDNIDKTLSKLVDNIVKSINTFLEDGKRSDNIANAIKRLIKAAVETAYGLMTGINWTKLAENIGKYIREAIEGIDPEKVAESFRKAIGFALDMIINTPWDKIAKFSMDLFNQILTAIPDELAKRSPAEVASKVAEALNIIIDDMNPANIANTVNAFIDWVREFWETVVEKVNWKDLVDKICQAIRDVDWKEALKVVWEVVTDCFKFKYIFKFDTISTLVADIGHDLATKVEEQRTTFEGVGANMGQRIREGFKKAVSNLLSGSNALFNTQLNLKIPGFASGGVVYGPTAAVVGEYAGASSNPEIITPENKMREIFAEGNGQLAEVYMQVGRQILQAIENKNLNVSIGDDQIAKSAARGNNNYKLMTGVPLIV